MAAFSDPTLADRKQAAEQSLKEARVFLESMEGRAFVDLLQYRLSFLRDAMVDAPVDRVAYMQGAAREIRDILKRMKAEG